jgi:Tfp pilus assembly protein PilV
MFGRLSRAMDLKVPKAIRRYKGLSIIEVALASGLLIVAMVPILKALTQAHTFSSQIEYKTQSLVLAQGKLDEIKAKAVYHYSSSYAATNTSLGNSYLCNITDTGSGTNLRTITVSVGFDGNGNGVLASDEVDVTLTTYIANRWQ